MSRKLCSKCRAKIAKEKEIVTVEELKKLSAELKMLRQTQRSILASGGYGQKEWLRQRTRMAGAGVPKDEKAVIDKLWKRRHDLAMQLKRKADKYVRDHERVERIIECCEADTDDEEGKVKK